MLLCSYLYGTFHLWLNPNFPPTFASNPRVECGWGEDTIFQDIQRALKPSSYCSVLRLNRDYFTLVQQHNSKNHVSAVFMSLIFPWQSGVIINRRFSHHNPSNQMVSMHVDKLHFCFAAEAMFLLLL